MSQTYDLIVIGSGVAAQIASARVRAAGRSVAVIDHRPFGGTCALRGCDPKKVLISGAAAVDFARRMHPHGVEGSVRIDWPALMAFKRSFTDPVPARQEESYAQRGVDGFHGAARFIDRDVVTVNGSALRGKHILIATGARPVPLAIAGAEHLTTSERFLELQSLPERIGLVGGGYIAAEFSHIAARAGAHVTILQRGPRLLPRFDPDLVDWLTGKYREIGIEIYLQAAVEAVQTLPKGLLVRARTDRGPARVEADCVIHAAGRAPDIADLDLAAAGIAVEGGRLKLNEYLQSVSNPAVYAAGDAASAGPALTPVSSLDGKVVAANILDGNHQRPDYRAVPSVAFTLPPIAAVGLSEEQARQRGIAYRVNSMAVPGWFSARRVAESVYGFKTIIEKNSGRVLGAHLVGPDADEVINVFALAIRHDVSAEELKSTIFAYPTGASDIASMI